MLNCQKAWGRQIRSICFPLNYYVFLKGHKKKKNHRETFLLLMETHVIGEGCYQRLMCGRCEGDEARRRHELTLPRRWGARTSSPTHVLPGFLTVAAGTCPPFSLGGVTMHTKLPIDWCWDLFGRDWASWPVTSHHSCTERLKQLILKCDFFQTWKQTIPTNCFRICGIGKPFTSEILACTQ